MNLIYGTIIEIFDDTEMRTARVHVGGVVRNVAIDLVADAQCGDDVLICDGVAIAKTKMNYVPGHSR